MVPVCVFLSSIKLRIEFMDARGPLLHELSWVSVDASISLVSFSGLRDRCAEGRPSFKVLSRSDSWPRFLDVSWVVGF